MEAVKLPLQNHSLLKINFIAKDTFIEEYITDPLKTAEDKLVINFYVPLK